MVFPYIDMNPSQVYMYSLSWTTLPPPSPSHPSGLSQCTSSEHPVSCIEPGLASCFPYDNLHVSMPFSHPHPLPQSPKDCSIHLCLYCCPAYIFQSVQFLSNFQFLDSFFLSHIWKMLTLGLFFQADFFNTWDGCKLSNTFLCGILRYTPFTPFPSVCFLNFCIIG